MKEEKKEEKAFVVQELEQKPQLLETVHEEPGIAVMASLTCVAIMLS